MNKYDLSDSNVPPAEKVTRIVRPFHHIGPACGGDEVTLNASELSQVAVSDSLCTAKEMRAIEKQAEEARLARMRSPTDDAARVVNDQMAKAIVERKARKAKERIDEMAKFKDAAEALKSLAG